MRSSPTIVRQAVPPSTLAVVPTSAFASLAVTLPFTTWSFRMLARPDESGSEADAAPSRRLVRVADSILAKAASLGTKMV